MSDAKPEIELVETKNQKEEDGKANFFVEDENDKASDFTKAKRNESNNDVYIHDIPVSQTLGHGLLDWLSTTLVGFFVVSYWRGGWTLMDILGCQQPVDATLGIGNTFCFMVDAGFDPSYAGLRLMSAAYTYIAGLILTFAGVILVWKGVWVPQKGKDGGSCKISSMRALLRIFTAYLLGWAAICTWRGVWYLTDYFLLPTVLTPPETGFPITSWWTSCLVGMVVCFLFCAGSSLLAPPAIFLLDGPGLYPPPLAVTILSSYYSLKLPANEKPPKNLSKLMIGADFFISFLVVPFFVVWYWRGAWLILDNYLWGFTPDETGDLNKSIGYGAIITFICYAIANEATLSIFLPSESHGNKIFMEVLNRLRTVILAIGTVNFWRVVWYVWDQFLGGTSTWSACISHFGSFIALVTMGCGCCVVAPASTLGVDCLPHEECADEPLFSFLPIATESLFFFAVGQDAIAPSPEVIDEEVMKEEAAPEKSSFLEMQRPALSSSIASKSARDLHQSMKSSLVDSIASGGSRRRHQSSSFRNR